MMDFNIPESSHVFVYDDCGFQKFETFIVKNEAVLLVSVPLNFSNIRYVSVGLERNVCRASHVVRDTFTFVTRQN
jgi:hypothetical protein